MSTGKEFLALMPAILGHVSFVAVEQYEMLITRTNSVICLSAIAVIVVISCISDCELGVVLKHLLIYKIQNCRLQHAMRFVTWL